MAILNKCQAEGNRIFAYFSSIPFGRITEAIKMDADEIVESLHLLQPISVGLELF